MIANLITASRIVLLAPLFLLLLRDEPAARWGALAVMLLAGLTDVVDGRVARALGQTSAFGAMLDLISDRLLTTVLVVGLIAGGGLGGAWSAAGLVLIGRDLVVASFGEATRGAARFPVTALEKVKITAQFLGLGLLVAPGVLPLQHEVGRMCLAAAAALSLWTLVAYGRRATAALP